MISVLPDHTQISVAPPFNALPHSDDDLIEMEALVVPCAVFTWLLADLHGFTFQYEALHVAAAKITKLPQHDPGAVAMTAFRAFAGLSPSTTPRSQSVVETVVFGKAGSPVRSDFMKWVQRQMKMEFLHASRSAYVTFTDRCSWQTVQPEPGRRRS
jgi:hypothetical protein